MTRSTSDGGEDPPTPPRTLPRAAYRELDDTALVDAMRSRDEYAIDEFIVRHQRLLTDRARQWHAALSDVEDRITDVLEDIAVLIVNGRIRPTRSIAAYVVKAFRVQLALRSKVEGQRLRLECDAAADAAGLGERAISATVSEGTRYAHMQTNDVAARARVTEGQQIGTIGQTGNAQNTPVHVHFEVVVDGDRVDPETYLNSPCPQAREEER